jgi:ureidoglycolate hydrolase
MPSVRTIVLRARPLTPAEFEPFGALPSDEGSEHDVAEAEFRWNDGCVNYIGHALDEVEHGAIGLRCALLNRHDTHTQTLLPVDVDALVVVAPASVSFDDRDGLDEVRAFLVPRGRCIHLWRGTWHWGPYPVAAESVRLLNVQGRGYVRDNAVVELDRRHAVVFEVDAG